MTPAEELALVDAAITKVLEGAQSFTKRGRSINLPDLDKLTRRRDQLQQQVGIASFNGGSMASVAEVTRPT